jgi:hypothetical protein
VAAVLEALGPVIALVLGVLLEFFSRRAQPSAEDGDPDAQLRDRLRARVRQYWPVVLVCMLALSGCGSGAPFVRTIYVPDGTPVRLRETIKGAKVWVKDANGQAVPGRMDLPEGWYCLPVDEEAHQQSSLPADEFPLPDWDNHRIHSSVRQGAVEHRPKGLAMIDRIVRNQQPASDQLRDNCLIAVRVHFLLGVQEAEGDLADPPKVLASVPGHELHGILYTCHRERLARQFDLCRQHLERRHTVPCLPARQGEPQRGVASTGADLNPLSDRRSCSQHGDELACLRGYLPQPLKPRRSIGSVLGIKPFQSLHPCQNSVCYVVEHGDPFPVGSARAG